MKTKDYTVLIAGRENVGKSSIFNKLINRQKSIVDDFPGVTRDKILSTPAASFFTSRTALKAK